MVVEFHRNEVFRKKLYTSSYRWQRLIKNVFTENGNYNANCKVFMLVNSYFIDVHDAIYWCSVIYEALFTQFIVHSFEKHGVS